MLRDAIEAYVASVQAEAGKLQSHPLQALDLGCDGDFANARAAGNEPANVRVAVELIKHGGGLLRCTNLRVFTAAGFGWFTRDAVDVLARVMSAARASLEWVSLADGGLAGDGATDRLFAALSECVRLRGLDLHHTALDKAACVALGELLAARASSIEWLGLCFNYDVRLRDIVTRTNGDFAVAKCTSLRTLYYAGQTGGDLEKSKGPFLAQVIRSCQRLEVLDVGVAVRLGSRGHA